VAHEGSHYEGAGLYIQRVRPHHPKLKPAKPSSLNVDRTATIEKQQRSTGDQRTAKLELQPGNIPQPMLQHSGHGRIKKIAALAGEATAVPLVTDPSCHSSNRNLQLPCLLALVEKTNRGGGPAKDHHEAHQERGRVVCPRVRDVALYFGLAADSTEGSMRLGAAKWQREWLDVPIDTARGGSIGRIAGTAKAGWGMQESRQTPGQSQMRQGNVRSRKCIGRLGVASMCVFLY
jgi:hypothetical protein